MPPPEPPNEIVIRVKVPPGHIPGTGQDEFSLGSLNTSHTIATLRQRMQTLIPTNPTPSSQRVLYGGRALVDDTQTLADALNTRRDPGQTEYVVHLLIRPGGGAIPRAETGSATGGLRTGGVAPPIQGAETQPPWRAAGLGAGMTALTPEQTQMLASATALPHNPDGTPPLSGSQFVRPRTPGSEAAGMQPGQATHGQPHHHHHHHHPHAHFHHAAQAHGHGQPRPLSGSGFHLTGTGPNGQHFAIHQQTFNLPGMPNNPTPMQGFPGNPLPGLAFPGLQMPFPGMQHAPPRPAQPSAVSALDRARENMVEMRRMLDLLRNDLTTEETRRRVADLETRIEAVNDYIDPFRVSGQNIRPTVHTHSSDTTTNTASQPRSSPAPFAPSNVPSAQPTPMPATLGEPPLSGPPNRRVNFLQQVRQRNIARQFTEQTSVYLLSSPQGPQAVVFSPQHGSYSGSLPNLQPNGFFQPPTHPGASAELGLAPTPTQPIPQNAQGNAAAPAAHLGQQEQAGNGQVAQVQADPMAMLQPILGHFWLLFRIMIFAYFLMGAELGWRRPVALLLIGVGFWLIRLGLFGNGGLVRRWWDGVVRIEDVRERLRRLGLPVDGPQVPNQALAAGPQAQQNDARPNAAAAPARPFPTPEELAQRLVRERQQQQRAPLYRLREQIRPAERALALFIASLWPGVGERYVQALDAAREEEERARRVLESQQDETAQQAAEGVEPKDKPDDVPGSSSQETAEASQSSNVTSAEAEKKDD